MPTILRHGRHRFFFYSNEGSEPPHIHVETASNAAKFWLEPISLAESYGYNSRELGALTRIVRENQDLFLEKWYEFFGSA